MQKGFTFVELSAVLLIVALLASLVAPVVIRGVKEARESVLEHDLSVVRKALDDYYSDKGLYPANLNELVQQRYLRSLPQDPFTEKSDSWELVLDAEGGGVSDLRSGAAGVGRNGILYRDW